MRGLAEGYWWTFTSKIDRELYTGLAINLQIERGYNTMDFSGWSQQASEDRRRAQPDEDETGLYFANTTVYSGALPLPHKCPNQEACKGGLAASCAEGYTGVLCASCSTGYTSVMGSCLKCGPIEQTISIIVVLSLLVAGVVVYVWRTNTKVASTVGNGAKSTPRERLMNKLKIIIGFMQVVASIAVSFQAIRWPDNFIRMINGLQFTTLDFLSLASPSCLNTGVEFNFYSSLLFAILLPLILVGLSWCFYAIRRQLMIGRASAAHELPLLLASAIRNSFFFVFLLYPGTAQQIFRMLQPCDDLCAFEGQADCASYLPSDYSIQCNDGSTHYTYTVLTAAVAVPLCVVAFPFLTAVLLYRRRDAVKRVQQAISNDSFAEEDDLTPMLRGMSFFFEAYKPTGLAYLWEVVDTLRKLFLTSIMLVITDQDSYSQIVIGVCVAFFFVWLIEYVRPFSDPCDHVLQQLAFFVIALNLVIGLALRAMENETSDRSAEEVEADREVLGVVLITINSILLTVSAWELVVQLVIPRWSLVSRASASYITPGIADPDSEGRKMENEEEEATENDRDVIDVKNGDPSRFTW